MNASTQLQDDPRDQVQANTREWIKKVLERRGWTPNRLAKEAGVSPATIFRALNDDRFVTSTTTLEKIAAAAGVPSPMQSGTGFAEPDGITLVASQLPAILTPVLNQVPWELRTRAAELAGYLPGDVLLVDPDVAPASGDLVCAQVYNFQNGTAETVFRIFEPPYLIARTMDPSITAKPLLVDDERVKIWGVAVRSLRTRGG